MGRCLKTPVQWLWEALAFAAPGFSDDFYLPINNREAVLLKDLADLLHLGGAGGAITTTELMQSNAVVTLIQVQAALVWERVRKDPSTSYEYQLEDSQNLLRFAAEGESTHLVYHVATFRLNLELQPFSSSALLVSACPAISPTHHCENLLEWLNDGTQAIVTKCSAVEEFFWHAVPSSPALPSPSLQLLRKIFHYYEIQGVNDSHFFFRSVASHFKDVSIQLGFDRQH